MLRVRFEALEEPWQGVPRPALIAWLVFYGLILLLALLDDDGFLFIDNANLIVHEAGHLLFSYLGETLSIWGGTLFELFVPAALALTFTFRRHLQGAAFCIFLFFENFLYIATYMADARRQELPLVSVGGGDIEHDWHLIFSSLGLLNYDTTIAALTRALGWLGMLATVAWLAWRAHCSRTE
ncbi:MAG TPA: hypothetical protein VNN18_02555 [Candidatus Xenobia bacterium]|nr:hypothetical protein [Candidatus Xenobia bacterium]